MNQREPRPWVRRIAAVVLAIVVGAAGGVRAQTVWTPRVSGTNFNLYSVIWAGNRFVAVGVGGTVVTSPDGVTWTKQVTPNQTPLTGVAWSGSRFVAVGQGATPVLTSTNGTQWTVVTSVSAAAYLTAVTWSGTRFVAVGQSGVTLTSTDGLNWATRFTSQPYALTDVTWTGSQFVAVGAGGVILTSPDGAVWTKRTSGTTATLLNVTSSGSRIVATGQTGVTLASTDGINWAYRNVGYAVDLMGATWMGTQFVSVGWSLLGLGVFASSIGADWTATYLDSGATVEDVAWSGTRLVAVGGAGFVMTSTPQYAYVRAHAGAPWGSTVPATDPGSNESAMDRAFGEDNWDDLRYEWTSGAAVFAPGREVVFLEGGDDNQNELQAFLTINAVAMQAWVSNGGHLLINAAPSEGGGIACGFGVTLDYNPPATVLDSVAAVVPGHPVFVSPAAVGSSFTGSDFSRATVSGTGLTSLLAGAGADSGKVVLAELGRGAGKVVFGGMTMSKFHSPQPQANNFRSNILSYLRPSSVPAPEISVEQPADTVIADGGSKDFGNVTVGENASLTFVVRNIGRADLTGIAVTKDGANAGDFSVTANPAGVIAGPSGRTQFTVRFAPSAPGVRTATLHVASNDADENPYDIVVTGNGQPVVPDIAVTVGKDTAVVPGGTADFGTVAPRKKRTLVFRVSNTGTGPLGGLAVTMSGPNVGDFKLTAKFTAPLKPGASKTFKVQFAPTSAGLKQAVVRIASDDPDAAENPYLINLTGSALAALAAVAPRMAETPKPADTGGAGVVVPPPVAVDSDGDGLADLLEEATGGDPRQVSPSPVRVERAAGRLALVYPRSVAAVAAGRRFAVEWSDDLRTWNTEGVEERVEEESAGIERVRAEVSTGGAGAKFMRLRVSSGP